MSKWLLKHYFRWNEKHNQKQSFDWIQGLCWTLPPNSSLPLSTFAPWCQLHHFPHYAFGICEHLRSLFLPYLFSLPLSLLSLSSCPLLTLSLLFYHSFLPLFIPYSQPPSAAVDLQAVCSRFLSACISLSLPSLYFILNFFSTRYSLCALLLLCTCLNIHLKCLSCSTVQQSLHKIDHMSLDPTTISPEMQKPSTLITKSNSTLKTPHQQTATSHTQAYTHWNTRIQHISISISFKTLRHYNYRLTHLYRCLSQGRQMFLLRAVCLRDSVSRLNFTEKFWCWSFVLL